MTESHLRAAGLKVILNVQSSSIRLGEMSITRRDSTQRHGNQNLRLRYMLAWKG